MSGYDPERAAEYTIDPALEEALESMADNMRDLIYQIEEMTNLKREKVVALGLVTLYHQLELRKAGKIVIVADGPTTHSFADPLSAVTAYVTTDDFTDVLAQLNGSAGG